MIIVTAAIIQRESKILIARRSPHKHLGGYWELPGGKLEPEESLKDCLRRELKEELGIEVIIGDFFKENMHVYERGTILLKAFHCEYLSGDLQLNDHDKYEWADISNLQEYQFAPADIPIINALKNI